MPPPPWWEDVSAGVRQGDLASPDVQHLQHGLRVQLVSGKGQSFYQGEAEDGEGHDRQGDGEDHTPEGKSWWGSCQRSLWRVARVRSTWGCRPGGQAQWQGKERWARGGAARRSTPPASTTSAHGWTFVVDSVGEVVRRSDFWVHLDQAGKAPVGEGRIFGVHLNSLAAGADVQLYTQPPLMTDQSQLRGFSSSL